MGKLTGEDQNGEKDSLRNVCAACGLRVSSDEDVCPRCGNVFRREVGEWDWKLIPKQRKLKKAVQEKKVNEEADDD